MKPLIKIAENYLGIGQIGIAEIMGYYNKHCYPLVDSSRKYKIKSNDEWCAAFVSVVAHKRGISPDVFPYEVSVFFQYKQALEWGEFTKYLDYVEIGDLILYDWGTGNRFNHVGFIKDITPSHIITVEGNFKGTVGNRRVSRNSSSIKGFICVGRVNKSLDIERAARDVIAGKYGDGDERVRRLGDNYHRVQKRVNEILTY